MALEISNQYLYTGRGPFDTKSLVKTYADLLLEKTWLSANGKNTAYNGMIVAVWLNSEDLTRNGIYYLHDSTITSTFKAPDVTNEANWHKIAELAEISDLTAKIIANTNAITDEVNARVAAIAAIYKAGDESTVASGLLVEEIARASAAEQAIAEALSTLAGSDTGKTIRAIAVEEIARMVDTGDQTVSAYVTDQIAKLVQFKASAEITIDEDGTLGLGEVSTDKIVQGTHTLVFNGGGAK